MTHQNRSQSIQCVLKTTLVANLLVAVGKLTVGILSRSLSMVADGIHSLVDATSNIVGLIGSAIASQPPDDEHPYGHRRFETLASLVIGGSLLLTAWEISKSSVERLINPVEPEIGPINFIVMIVTLIINIVVSTYERQQGKKLKAEVLLADADHTRTDIYISLAVLAGLVAVKLGLPWADALIALIVVGLIITTAWGILRRAAGILVDQAALDPTELGQLIEAVPGVDDVIRVRSRGPDDAVPY